MTTKIKDKKQKQTFPLRFYDDEIQRKASVLAAAQNKSLTELINEVLEREVSNFEIIVKPSKQHAGAGQ